MKVLEQVELRLDWVDANNLYPHPYPQHQRGTDKVHVSQIIRYIAEKMGKLTPQDLEDEMPIAVLLGIGWEVLAWFRRNARFRLPAGLRNGLEVCFVSLLLVACVLLRGPGSQFIYFQF